MARSVHPILCATVFAALLAAAPAAAWDEAAVARVKAGEDCLDCDLAGADLAGRGLRGLDLSGANLRGARLTGSVLSDVVLFGANLRGAKLERTRIDGTYFLDANLDGADLSDAEIVASEFSGASLEGTIVTGTDMSEAFDADLAGVIDRTPKTVAAPAPPAPPPVRTALQLGSVFLLAAPSCPAGTAPADGATLPIPGNEALFSLLGDAYGGDARTVFKLPDLQAEAPLPGLRYCVVTSGQWPSRP